MMTISTLEAHFPCEVAHIWDIMTNFDNCTWRSDIKRIEVIDELHFIEYTQKNFATNFIITNMIPNQYWSFQMENDNMKGEWIGEFTYEHGTTILHLHEEVHAKKWFMKPFVKSYLKKQQTSYIRDVKKAL